jgi:hypothetical protein
MEIANEERSHESLLRGALSTAAVAQPAIDSMNSFNGHRCSGTHSQTRKSEAAMTRIVFRRY